LQFAVSVVAPLVVVSADGDAVKVQVGAPEPPPPPPPVPVTQVKVGAPAVPARVQLVHRLSAPRIWTGIVGRETDAPRAGPAATKTIAAQANARGAWRMSDRIIVNLPAWPRNRDPFDVDATSAPRRYKDFYDHSIRRCAAARDLDFRSSACTRRTRIQTLPKASRVTLCGSSRRNIVNERTPIATKSCCVVRRLLLASAPSTHGQKFREVACLAPASQ